MMQFIDDHTVKLTPDAPKKQRSYKQFNSLERLVINSIKSAMTKEVRGQIFYQRQLALADRYQEAVELRNKLKSVGLPGFMSVPVACKVVRPR